MGKCVPMSFSNSPTPNFAQALAIARQAKGLTQEQLSSGRTYISALERGLKQPTVAKVAELAESLGIHPVTLFALAFMSSLGDSRQLVAQLTQELEWLHQRFSGR